MKKNFSIKYTLYSILILLLFGNLNIFGQKGTSLIKRGPLRVLIFSGCNNHNWRETTPYMKKILLDTGRFDVRVIEETVGITFETLEAYDMLVINYCGPRWGEVTEKAVEEFVKSGKGLVAVHQAVYPFSGLPIRSDNRAINGTIEPPWNEYAEMIGCKWSEEPPVSGHGEMHSFNVKFINSEHPITGELGESFIATDQLYHNFRMKPNVEILASAYDDTKIGGTGKNEPMLWTVKYGKGRVFFTALGHDITGMQQSGFITTFVRGCEWAGSGTVTLTSNILPHSRNQNALRVLVVTGGHNYDTEFYSVFMDFNDIIWSHKISNYDAYKTDLREKYDALVLYDSAKEIGENESKNLRAFVESGKGVVVLHHAITNYNSWEWWYKEVVGGKYLLKPDLGMPPSTFKHDEEMFVYPVTRHPITSRVGRIHIHDETYKGMWISPDVTVLMETDNPNNGKPVVWISPYDKSKVVYIQLGHDRNALLHTGYQKLVRRAILWSAGKLK